MRILHAISSLDPAGGGPQEGLRQLCAALSDTHVNEVMTLDLPGAPWEKTFPTAVHGLGAGRRGYGYVPGVVQWLRTHVTEYDAVVAHGLWQYHGFAVWRAMHNLPTPYFVYPHGMLDPWFKQAYPLKHFKKWLYWPWAEYRVLRDARAVLFTCEDEMRLAARSFRYYRCNGIVAGFGVAMPGGTPCLQRAAFIARFPGLAHKRILLFLGRVHPKKGCDILLEGFAVVARRDPALQLVFAGPDRAGWQAVLAARATALGVADRITWTGMLSGDAKWGAFYAADAFVLTSHQENFGVAVAEALACGVPVLISDKVNIWREIVADGAGFVASDDVAGAKALLHRWIESPPGLRDQMRKNAGVCFGKNFQIDAVAQRFVEILEHERETGGATGAL